MVWCGSHLNSSPVIKEKDIEVLETAAPCENQPCHQHAGTLRLSSQDEQQTTKCPKKSIKHRILDERSDTNFLIKWHNNTDHLNTRLFTLGTAVLTKISPVLSVSHGVDDTVKSFFSSQPFIIILENIEQVFDDKNCWFEKHPWLPQLFLTGYTQQ